MSNQLYNSALLFQSADKRLQQVEKFLQNFDKFETSTSTRSKNLLKTEVINHLSYKPNNLEKILKNKQWPKSYLLNLYKAVPNDEHITKIVISNHITNFWRHFLKY